MSQEPTEMEISTALEKLAITNDLEKNRENNETSYLFKTKTLCVTDRKKRETNALILTPSVITYPGRKILLSKY